MRQPFLAIAIVLSAVSPAPAYAQNSILGDNYSIMVPEKGYKPSYLSLGLRRSTSRRAEP
jgi:hypothetical protein